MKEETKKMTLLDAIHEIETGIIPGIRGSGCATICLLDGREVWWLGGDYVIDEDGYETSIHDTTVGAECVSWSVDQLGGRYF